MLSEHVWRLQSTQYSPYMDRTFCQPFFCWRTLWCFLLWTESVTICVYILGWTYVFNLPETHADSYHNCMFNLFKNLQTVFQGSWVLVTFVPVMCAVLTSLYSCNSSWCLPFGPRGQVLSHCSALYLPEYFMGSSAICIPLRKRLNTIALNIGSTWRYTPFIQHSGGRTISMISRPDWST